MAFTAEQIAEIETRYGIQDLVDGEFTLYRSGSNDVEKRSKAYIVGDDTTLANVMSTVYNGQNEVLILDGTVLSDTDGVYEQITGDSA